MVANLDVLKSDLKLLQTESHQLGNTLTDSKLEEKAVESKITTLKSEQERLLNVDNQKLELMSQSIPQGKDAKEAALWLYKNLDKFQGKVYLPILMQINVKDPATSAIYLGKQNCRYTSVDSN